MKEEIKKIITGQNWTMKDVAGQLNISESYLYKLLNGSRDNEKRLKEIKEVIVKDKELPTLPYLANAVKVYAIENKCSLGCIAKKVNISLPYLYDLLNGRRKNQEKIKEIEDLIRS